MRLHLAADARRGGFPESGAESAAEDHSVEVEEVDDRCRDRREGLVRVVDQLSCQGVVVLERLLPDAARQPVALGCLHQLEQLRLLAVLMQLARALCHRTAPGVGLGAAVPPARTAPSAHPHDHVPDLAGRAPAVPALSLEDDGAAHARAPPDGQEQQQRAA